MLAFLADENFNGQVLHGLLLREPRLDIVRVQDLEIDGANDRTVLAWTAKAGRVVLTHDRQTMPDFAYLRMVARERMSGVVVLSTKMPIGQAIEETLLIAICLVPAEIEDRVIHLPL